MDWDNSQYDYGIELAEKYLRMAGNESYHSPEQFEYNFIAQAILKGIPDDYPGKKEFKKRADADI